MKTKHASFIAKSLLLAIFLTIITTGSFSQSKNQGTNQQQKQQTLTPQQTATIKNILSKYDPKKLTAADAKAIHERFRQAGIHAGPETKDAIIAAGFDPDKLRSLDPPKEDENPNRPNPPSVEERLKNVETNVIKPLSLNASQSQVVLNAFKEFYSEVENLRKTQENQPGPKDRSKMEPLKLKRDDKIKKVLTTAQFTKYQELEKNLHPHRNDSGNPERK